jgi:3-phenylpropionate/trans-cinnamate dioxygenase ferredoxin component
MASFYDALPTDWIGPGETATVEVDEFPVAIANVAGDYFAFQNLCPHQGTSLGGRPLDDCFITCPQHASRYDVRTGECVRAAEGDGFNQDLMTFPTRVVDDVVQVEI